MSGAIVWLFANTIFILLVACQPQEETPRLLDTPENAVIALNTPENAVIALNTTCLDRDIEGVLALYEDTSRQELADRITKMREDAAAVGGISSEDLDGIALTMICIPVANIEPEHIETSISGINATVLYVYDKDSPNSVVYQIDLVQQGAIWMITNVEFKLPSEN